MNALKKYQRITVVFLLTLEMNLFILDEILSNFLLTDRLRIR